MLIKRKRRRAASRYARLILCAVLVAVPARDALAQDAVPAGYKVHTLQFADPSIVGEQLQKALANAAGPPDVLIDRQFRRILVRGDDALQLAATDLIRSLDQRPRRDKDDVEQEPVMQSYRVAPDELNKLASELREAFPPSTGLRVAADETNGRLFVRAPAELQKAIGARIAMRGGVLEKPEKASGDARGLTAETRPNAVSATTPPLAGPARPPASAPSERRTHILRNITWRELEEQIQQVWGSELQSQVHNNGEMAVLQAATASGQPVQVEIDRRRDQVAFVGPGAGARAWERIVQVLDRPYGPEENRAHLVRYQRADPRAVQRAVMLLDRARRDVDAAAEAEESEPAARPRRSDPVSAIFQPKASAPAAAPRTPRGLAPAAAPRDAQPPAENPVRQGAPAQNANFQLQPEFQPEFPPGQPQDGQLPFGLDGQPLDQLFDGAAAPQDALAQLGAFIGTVQIEFIEELNLIIVRGNAADVQRVMQLIEEIESIVDTTTPTVEIYHLRYANSAAIATLVTTTYDAALAGRAGQVSITALGKPNALLLIGREDGVRAVIELVAKLDQPMPANSEFKVFHLRSMSAIDAETRLTTLFQDPTALEPRVRVVGDYRSNALVVSASPGDLRHVERVLLGLDVPTGTAVDELRIFKLRNAIAIDLAPILQDALNGQLQNSGRGQGAQGALGQQQQLQGVGGTAQLAQIRSKSIIFRLIDSAGGQLLRSGITYDVRVTADEAGNALIVTAPADCMELIGAVIEQLDQLPDAEASIKVFQIVNGDATALATMLQQLFGTGQAGQGAGAGLQALLGAAAGTGESALVPLNFAVDTRTNTIIAAGAASDLELVEVILLRLDESDIRKRRVEVYRLRNAPAEEVADTINQYLNAESQIQTSIQDQYSLVDQNAREVVVVAEGVSNSLIVAATPAYFDEVRRLVEDLDRRPPMVMIQAVIAEVNLNRFVEFGIEWGLQDSLLFDRSTTTTAGNLNPGFNFNNQPLGNSASAASQATRDLLGGQSLSHFGLGRVNPGLGYGGLVLSAASDSVNILLRALQENGRAQVLSRPQIQTLDNQGAFVQVGARVPYITSTQVTQTGTVNAVELQDVGIILGVRPRVNPDGLIVMEVDVEKSELGPDATGVPISINANGDVIRALQILISTTQTTVSAKSGQTIILGGLITKSRSQTSRRIPYLSDIPVLGNLFRFDNDDGERTELLVILTPIVIFGDDDSEWIKVVESDRMSWVLGDLVEIHGEVGLSPGRAGWGRPRAPVIFPADDPTASTFFDSDNNVIGDSEGAFEDGFEDAEEIGPGELPPVGSSRPGQINIPPPYGSPPTEAQSSRRGAVPQDGPTAANGAWHASHVAPPVAGPDIQQPWYAEGGSSGPEGYQTNGGAAPVGYAPAGNEAESLQRAGYQNE